MTQRLQQALKLLQVPTLELQQILKQEIMHNPLLEEVDELVESEDLAKENSPEEAAEKEPEDPAEEDPVDWSEYMQDGAFDRAYVPQGESSIEFLEKVSVTRTTLAESLLEQLHFLNLPKEHMERAEFLVGSLDDRGWLATPLEEVAQATGRGLEECQRVLKVIQALGRWSSRHVSSSVRRAAPARRADARRCEMLIVESYALAVALCVVTMFCWGSWANTQKLASREWRFQLFYWDYAIGVLLLALLLAFTAGSTGAAGRGFLPDLSQPESRNLGLAFLGGVVFNLSNILLVAAIDIAGMAVAFPIGVGLAGARRDHELRGGSSRQPRAALRGGTSR